MDFRLTSSLGEVMTSFDALCGPSCVRVVNVYNNVCVRAMCTVRVLIATGISGMSKSRNVSSIITWYTSRTDLYEFSHEMQFMTKPKYLANIGVLLLIHRSNIKH